MSRAFLATLFATRVPLLLSLLMAVGAGCSADRPLNPSFPLSLDDARRALNTMRTDPRPFERPVLVLGGLFDPGVFSGSVARELQRVADDYAVVLTVSFVGANDFDACRRRVLDAVDAAFGAANPDEPPREVDVVGISMGGLVGRDLGRPRDDDPRRLRVRRLFTIASPHRGARLAALPTFDARVLQMRAGSPFLAALDEAVPEPENAPEIVPYARLDDAIVGAARSAPPGRHPWWVANIPLSLAHMSAPFDPRILADIARRLRGEEPYTKDPPEPVPGTATTP